MQLIKTIFLPVILFAFFHTNIFANDASGEAQQNERTEMPYHFVFYDKVEKLKDVRPVTGQISRDGLQLYITAFDQHGSRLLLDLKRPSNTSDFRNATPVKGQVNTQFDPVMMSVAWDNLSMIFVHSATNREEDNRLFIAERNHIIEGFDRTRPLNELHEKGYAYKYPWISGDGLRLYYTRQKGSELEVRFAYRKSTGDRFTDGGPVLKGFERISNNLSVHLNNTEDELFLLSGQHIYFSKRSSTDEPFSEFTKMHTIDIPGYINSITFSADFQQMLVFHANEDFELEILHYVHQQAFAERK